MIKNIKFQDTTLRDGEQTPGIAYSLQDKIAMTDMLCKLNLNINYDEMILNIANTGLTSNNIRH